MITVSFCIEDTVVQVNQDNQSNGLNQLHTHGGRISAMILLLRSDVKQSATIFRHNVRQIRHWLEEESASAAKEMERAKPKEIPGKDAPKEEKHSREGEPKKPCVQRKPCVLGTSRFVLGKKQKEKEEKEKIKSPPNYFFLTKYTIDSFLHSISPYIFLFIW